MKKVTVRILVAFLFCAFLVALWMCQAVIRYHLALERHEQSYENMRVLRDRAKACPPDIAALRSLMSKLHSTDALERTMAIAFIGQVGSNAEPAVHLLIEALDSDDPFDAREAANSLGEIGPTAHPALPDLIKAMKEHPNADIGWFAAESLGKIANPNDTEVVVLLKQAAQGPDGRMRDFANRGLSTLRPNTALEPTPTAP